MARSKTQAKRAVPAGRVTRDDLERRFTAVQSGIQGKIEARKNTLITAGSVAAFVLALLVYLMGRRSGKRKTTLVEIRRL
jgi:hypothetical protein